MKKISLCLIVKDEEAVLERCINSLKGCYDELIIVDTGSSSDGSDAVNQTGGDGGTGNPDGTGGDGATGNNSSGTAGIAYGGGGGSGTGRNGVSRAGGAGAIIFTWEDGINNEAMNIICNA